MKNLPATFIYVFAIFSPLFFQPVYKKAIQLFTAHILSKGKRIVADLLRILNLKDIENYSKFHCVLSGSKWSTLK